MVRKKGLVGPEIYKDQTMMKGQGLGVRTSSNDIGRIPRASSPARGMKSGSGALVFPKSVIVSSPVVRPDGISELKNVEEDELINGGENEMDQVGVSWVDRVDSVRHTAPTFVTRNIGGSSMATPNTPFVFESGVGGKEPRSVLNNEAPSGSTSTDS